MSQTPIRLGHLSGVPTPSQVPLFRRLAEDPRLDFSVIFASADGVRPFDDGFGQPVSWDADLTSGYTHTFLNAAERTPGLGQNFFAVRNWDVAPVVARSRFDVLWMSGYNSVTYLLGALTQRATGGAVLFREEQTLLDPRPLKNVVAKQLTLRPLFALGRALYISTENRRWFESYGVGAERLFATPYSVDNDEFRAEATRLMGQRAALRQELGVPSDTGPVIASVSRLIPKKQPLFLLEAFRRVRERIRCTLLVVGSGPLEQDLRDAVTRYSIPDVVFTGFLNRSQIARAYAAADVFALLSREHETFGLVVNEAMNFRLPIVVSDRVGCAPDLVGDGANGFIVPAHDVEAAARALERLVTDDELRSRMGEASLERIGRWGIEQTAEGIIDAAVSAVAEDLGRSRHRPRS